MAWALELSPGYQEDEEMTDTEDSVDTRTKSLRMRRQSVLLNGEVTAPPTPSPGVKHVYHIQLSREVGLLQTVNGESGLASLSSLQAANILGRKLCWINFCERCQYLHLNLRKAFWCCPYESHPGKILPLPQRWGFGPWHVYVHVNKTHSFGTSLAPYEHSH